MTWRKYKKKVKRVCGKGNAKFCKKNGNYYQAIRVSEKLTFVSNHWMSLDFN